MFARLRAFVRFLTGDSSSDGADGDVDDDEPGFWGRIPGRQYTGRYAEAGGVTRREQEEAIADVAEQAEELANQADP